MTASPDTLLVGIDIGTTNLKAVALRPDGRVDVVVRRGMVIDHPGPGAAEFDLDALDRNLLSALAELVERLEAGGRSAAQIVAIGVDSIGESFVGVDDAGRRITSCPTWYDRRTAKLRPEWEMSAECWYDITGMVDDDIYTAYRLSWWRAHDGERFACVRRWFMVADYAAYLLCGNAVSNPSLAARSGLADRTTGAWSPEILAHVGIDPEMLPELRPQATPAGFLKHDIAAATGLPRGIPVINAGHDHPCAGFGCGLVEPGAMIDSTGTSEALKTVLTRPLRYDEVGGGRYDCYPHVVPGRFLLSGHIPSSGGLLDWLVRLLSGPVPNAETAAALWRMAAEAPAGANGVRVAPFLEGTGAPWNQRARRADIAGLGDASSAGDILRAAVESLAGWLAVNLAAFESITGSRPPTLTLTGGGARNDVSNRIKAAFIGRPFVVPNVEEAAGTGAALVAGLATGVFADTAAAAALGAVSWRTIESDPALADAYAPLRAAILGHLPNAEGGNTDG